MKENAKLVLPKIAPFNENENETFKEDDDSKTRSYRKRVSRWRQGAPAGILNSYM